MDRRLRIGLIIAMTVLLIVMAIGTFKRIPPDDTTCAGDATCPDTWTGAVRAYRKCDATIGHWATGDDNSLGPGLCTVVCPPGAPYPDPSTMTCGVNPPPTCTVGAGDCGEATGIGRCVPQPPSTTRGVCQCITDRSRDPRNGCS